LFSLQEVVTNGETRTFLLITRDSLALLVLRFAVTIGAIAISHPFFVPVIWPDAAPVDNNTLWTYRDLHFLETKYNTTFFLQSYFCLFSVLLGDSFCLGVPPSSPELLLLAVIFSY